MIKEQEIELLFNEAKNARMMAYVPYSNFFVGAAILLTNGKIITGCNIENASYGLSNCAERTALFKAYSESYRKKDIKAMLVIGDTPSPISPCGACRQVMSELLSNDTTIILANLHHDLKITNIDELLPYSFDKEDLNA